MPERRDVSRDGMRFALDVDVSHDAAGVERHHLCLSVGPRTTEPRAIDARRGVDLFAADVPALADDRLPERQERPGILGRGRAERDAGRRVRVGHPPRGGRLEPVQVARPLAPDPHGRTPILDRDDGRTTDPVVRAGERIRVGAGGGERQQIPALDVGRERDRVGEHVTGLAVASDDGHGLVDRATPPRCRRHRVSRVVEHRPDVVRHPPVDGDHGPAVAERPTIAHPVQRDRWVPDDAAAGLGRERRHREAELTARHPQAHARRRRRCPRWRASARPCT